MKQQILTMLEMQDAMNTKVHEDWRGQQFEWYRAIWVECAELLDHYGWKWWKKQTPDMDQVILELIDIWHFGLSIKLSSGSELAEIADEIVSCLDFAHKSEDFRVDIEAFSEATLKTKAFDVSLFAKLMVGADLSFDRLFQSYVGKNVLNFFRQDHGYKEGTYIKVWNGKEDNEHLVEVLELLNAEAASFKDDVYAALEGRYPV